MKLTNAQKSKIIAEYASGGISQAKLAERYNVTQKTISKILNDEKVQEKVLQISEESTISMLAYLEKKRGIAQDLMSAAMDSIRAKINNASVKDCIALIKAFSEAFSGNIANNEESKATVIINLKDTSGEAKND